jgi:hypothetical protein
MGIRWHVEAFEFETEPNSIGARGTDADGRSVREHDGRQEFWTGKTWIFLPKEALVTKIPKFRDGYYLNTRTGEVFSRTGGVWYYWSTPHRDWKFLQHEEETLDKKDLLRIGRLGGSDD